MGVNRWMDTRQASRELGISPRTLREWRTKGFFVPGTHYRRKGPNPHSEVIWNVPACEKTIDDFTIQRAKEVGHV